MPQLNPEFFISQLFWLFITFSFLLIFLWRVSLPRINKVLEKRERKINDDIKSAKKLQAEAEEIQKKIELQLHEAKFQSDNLIKKANDELQESTANELKKLETDLNTKIANSSEIIEKNKLESLKNLKLEINSIVKLTFSKISDIKVSDDEISKAINNTKKRIVN